jgi:hypothetical protein
MNLGQQGAARKDDFKYAFKVCQLDFGFAPMRWCAIGADSTTEAILSVSSTNGFSDASKNSLLLSNLIYWHYQG